MNQLEMQAMLRNYFEKLAMGIPPPLPAAARGALGAAKSLGAAKQMAKPGTAAILAGAGTGFKQAPVLNPFKAAARMTDEEVTPHMDRAASTQSPWQWAAGGALGLGIPTAAAGAVGSAIGNGLGGATAREVAHGMGPAALKAGLGGAIVGGGMAALAHHRHKEHAKKHAADLTPAARAALPGSDFAVKAKKSNTGQEAYPIPDRQHARSALGFAKMHGDSADLAAVRKKIQAKYPDMLKSAMKYDAFFAKTAGSLLARMKGLGTELATSAPMQHKTELAGLGVLAAPVGYELQKNVREGHTGDAVANATELGGLGVLAAPAAAALRHH